jgi:predicted RNase H-like HicB family nuclease
MTDKTLIEYPALIYKNRKNNAYIANCIMFNLIGFGKTENQAIANLEQSMNDILKDYDITIKPMYEIPTLSSRVST